MHIEEVKEFCGRLATASAEEKKEVAKRLTADHDSIITYADLVARFPGMDKPSRQKLYRKLEAETFKYPGMVPSTHPLHPAFITLRAKMEHFRGIRRDQDGQILRDRPALLARKAVLEAKLADNLNRVKNINAELGLIAKELEVQNG